MIENLTAVMTVLAVCLLVVGVIWLICGEPSPRKKPKPVKPAICMDGNIEVLGVTMDWALNPTRSLRWPNGFEGILPSDYRLNPKWYNQRRWPINPETGEELPISL